MVFCMKREVLIDVLAFIGFAMLGLAAFFFGGFPAVIAWGGVTLLTVALLLSLAPVKP